MSDLERLIDNARERLERSAPTGHLDQVIYQPPEPGGSVPTNHLPTDVAPPPSNDGGSND
jgi:hypothetical protein